MRIDLHVHSSASDGTDSPAALVAAADAAGLDVFAITDHDTTAGWERAAAALPPRMALVRGAEFSTRVVVPGDRSVNIHLLAYLFDPLSPALLAEQQRLVGERMDRGMAMVDAMVADGVPISRDLVLQIADGAPVGRPHIGRALVQAGRVRSVTEAFERYLSGPGSYYLRKLDTDLEQAIAMVVAAGGAPVLAHPRGRGEGRALTPALLERLTGLGLVGLEVEHVDHDEAARAELRGIAADLGLVTTGSSDYHGTNKTVQLGASTTTPDALAAIVARTSGAVPVLGRW